MIPEAVITNGGVKLSDDVPNMWLLIPNYSHFFVLDLTNSSPTILPYCLVLRSNYHATMLDWVQE